VNVDILITALVMVIVAVLGIVLFVMFQPSSTIDMLNVRRSAEIMSSSINTLCKSHSLSDDVDAVYVPVNTFWNLSFEKNQLELTEVKRSRLPYYFDAIESLLRFFSGKKDIEITRAVVYSTELVKGKNYCEDYGFVECPTWGWRKNKRDLMCSFVLCNEDGKFTCERDCEELE